MTVRPCRVWLFHHEFWRINASAGGVGFVYIVVNDADGLGEDSSTW